MVRWSSPNVRHKQTTNFVFVAALAITKLILDLHTISHEVRTKSACACTLPFTHEGVPILARLSWHQIAPVASRWPALWDWQAVENERLSGDADRCLRSAFIGVTVASSPGGGVGQSGCGGMASSSGGRPLGKDHRRVSNATTSSYDNSSSDETENDSRQRRTIFKQRGGGGPGGYVHGQPKLKPCLRNEGSRSDEGGASSAGEQRHNSHHHHNHSHHHQNHPLDGSNGISHSQHQQLQSSQQQQAAQHQAQQQSQQQQLQAQHQVQQQVQQQSAQQQQQQHCGGVPPQQQQQAQQLLAMANAANQGGGVGGGHPGSGGQMMIRAKCYTLSAIGTIGNVGGAMNSSRLGSNRSGPGLMSSSSSSTESSHASPQGGPKQSGDGPTVGNTHGSSNTHIVSIACCFLRNVSQYYLNQYFSNLKGKI